MKTRTLIEFFLMIVVIAIITQAVVIAVFADVISVTAPPWDYCGFNETKAGTAFTCIQFDTDVITFK